MNQENKANGDRKADFKARARFYAIRQVNDERVYEWYRRVRSAAVECQFDSDNGPVTDKFVTGLRPGPVTDRLLTESVDIRLDDVLAIAVATEVETMKFRDSLPPSKVDMLGEIRQGLKLYQYSDELLLPTIAGLGDPNSDPKVQYNNKTFNGDMKSTLNGTSWWENKIEKKSKHKMLENFEEKDFIIQKLNINESLEKCLCENNESNYHDDSKCYCSRLTNSIYKANKYLTVKKTKNYSNTECTNHRKNFRCCACSIYE